MIKNYFAVLFVLCVLSSCQSVSDKETTSDFTVEPEIIPLSDFISLEVPEVKCKDLTKVSDDRHEEYQTVFNELFSKSGCLAGMSAALINADGNFIELFKGYIDSKKKIPVCEDSMFYSGSTGKMITSVIIFSLIEKGELKLNDRVTRYFPEYELLESVTIDHLLSHRSGIVNFTIIKEYDQNKNRYHTEKELVDLALDAEQNLLFEPGGSLHYCNTGYVLLGMIAQKASGQTMSELFDIIKVKCGLKKSCYNTDKNSYAGMFDSFDVKGDTVTAGHYHYEHPANAHAAGAFSVNSFEAVLFLRSLFAGKIVSKDTLNTMLGDFAHAGSDSNSDVYYGRGFHLIRLKVSNRADYIGHDGSLSGQKAMLYHCVQLDKTVSVLTNQNITTDPVMFRLAEYEPAK
ncbi:MAG: beta-lactamase family protein [Spirochaetes bacterium]|nr:beta-lactamase family protein [Spirochaetota bacterium]MBN2772210.1 beta-lactamase family protein [Spirochaetota bacterium]